MSATFGVETPDLVVARVAVISLPQMRQRSPEIGQFSNSPAKRGIFRIRCDMTDGSL